MDINMMYITDLSILYGSVLDTKGAFGPLEHF